MRGGGKGAERSEQSRTHRRRTCGQAPSGPPPPPPTRPQPRPPPSPAAGSSCPPHRRRPLQRRRMSRPGGATRTPWSDAAPPARPLGVVCPWLGWVEGPGPIPIGGSRGQPAARGSACVVRQVARQWGRSMAGVRQGWGAEGQGSRPMDEGGPFRSLIWPGRIQRAMSTQAVDSSGGSSCSLSAQGFDDWWLFLNSVGWLVRNGLECIERSISGAGRPAVRVELVAEEACA